MLKRAVTGMALSAAIGVPGLALAGDVALPDYAYDMVSVVTLATTADAQCDGISARDRAMQNYLVAMYGRLQQDGVVATDAAAAFQKPEAEARIAERVAAFRARYNVAGDDTAGFCAAIRKEAAANKDFGKLVALK